MTQEKIRKNKEHMKDVVSLLNTRRLTTFFTMGAQRWKSNISLYSFRNKWYTIFDFRIKHCRQVK